MKKENLGSPRSRDLLRRRSSFFTLHGQIRQLLFLERSSEAYVHYSGQLDTGVPCKTT